MTTTQMASSPTPKFDGVLNEVAKLDTMELEYFLAQVGILLAQRKAPSLSQQEAHLLTQINQGLPSKLQQRYDVLSIKLQSEIITPMEHQELLELLDQIEQADAKRMECLIELAQLCHVSLDILMYQLEIRPSQPHG